MNLLQPQNVALGPIAIVDDDPAVAQTLAAQIEQLGFCCEVHLCAKALLQALGDAHYRVIFLDLSLPDTDGIELFDLFEANDVQVPLILISGHSPAVMEAAKTIAEQKGLTILATMAKPLRSLQLAGVLDALAVHASDTVQA